MNSFYFRQTAGPTQGKPEWGVKKEDEKCSLDVQILNCVVMRAQDAIIMFIGSLFSAMHSSLFIY